MNDQVFKTRAQIMREAADAWRTFDGKEDSAFRKNATPNERCTSTAAEYIDALDYFVPDVIAVPARAINGAPHFVTAPVHEHAGAGRAVVVAEMDPRCQACWEREGVKHLLEEIEPDLCLLCGAEGAIFQQATAHDRTRAAFESTAWDRLRGAWRRWRIAVRRAALRAWATATLEIWFSEHTGRAWSWQPRWERWVSAVGMAENPYVRRVSARSSFVALVDHDDVFALGRRADGRSRFLSVRELALVSLALGLWPRVDDDAGPDDVLSAERAAIESALKRRGQRPMEAADLDVDARGDIFLRWSKRRIPRGKSPSPQK